MYSRQRKAASYIAEALADYLRSAEPKIVTLPTTDCENWKWQTAQHQQWELDVKAVADGFRRVNPAFDRERFITACKKKDANS